MQTIKTQERLESRQGHRADLIFSTDGIAAPHKSHAQCLTRPIEILRSPLRLLWNDQIGDLAGNGVKGCFESKWHAHQRTMPIEGRQKLVVNRKSVDSGQMSSQSAKSGWNVQDYLPASGVNHRHIAHELNGIAQALFGMKQNARAAERLAAPDRLRETTWLILFTLVTDFITAPTRGIVSLKQIKQAQVPSNIDGLRLQDKSA